MKFKFGNIEEFFLNTLLRISILGVFSILLSDIILYPSDVISIAIDSVILSGLILSYLIRKPFPTAAVLIFTSIILVSMLYQCLVVPANTTTSLSIILVVGFVFSVMLKGRLLWAAQGITFLSLLSVFFIQFIKPELRFSTDVKELATVAITYSILYFVLTYASWVLKLRYDEVNKDLKDANSELHQKAVEIEAQNDALLAAQETLNELNKNLEKKVMERTLQIRAQNEMLIKYSYANAHHLRGPVARMLGLASMYKLDPSVDANFLVNKMLDEVHEVDTVVKKLTVELENNLYK